MLKLLYKAETGLDIKFSGLDKLTFAPSPTREFAAGALQRNVSVPRTPKRGLPHHIRSNVGSGSESDSLRMKVARKGSGVLGNGNGRGHDLHMGRRDLVRRGSRAEIPQHGAAIPVHHDAIQHAKEVVRSTSITYEGWKRDRTKVEERLHGMVMSIDRMQVGNKEVSGWLQDALDQVSSFGV